LVRVSLNGNLWQEQKKGERERERERERQTELRYLINKPTPRDELMSRHCASRMGTNELMRLTVLPASKGSPQQPRDQ